MNYGHPGAVSGKDEYIMLETVALIQEVEGHDGLLDVLESLVHIDVCKIAANVGGYF